MSPRPSPGVLPDSEFTHSLGMATTRCGDGVCVIEVELEPRHLSVAGRAQRERV